MARRPRCTVCGSKRWHRDALSGSVVCDEGHLLQGYVHETTDTQEGPSQHTQTTRRIRKNKHKKHRPPANAHFHGHRARFLHYQALQLVLRHQLRALIDDLGWPAELEPVARDLWQLLVASSNLEPTPADARRDDEPPGSYAGPRPGLRYARRGRRKYGPRGGGGAGRARGRGRDGRDDDDDDSAGGDADAEREGAGEGDTDGSKRSSSSSSGSSSSGASGWDTESLGDQADDERPRAASRGPLSGPPSPAIPPLAPHGADAAAFNPFTPPRRTAAQRERERAPRKVVDDPREAPRLEFTLLIIYLACVTLRLPVLLSDIFRLAESYQILYLDAAVHLPRDMQEHLDGSTRDALSPKAVPHLYSHTPALERQRDDAAEVWLQRLVVLFRDDWGVHLPEANVPLLVGRVVEMLALPPLIALLTTHLLSHLPGPPSFHLPTSSHTPAPSFWRARRDGGDGSGRREGEWPRMGKRLRGAMDWRGALPEVKVASLVVCVVRLVWRLDEEGEGSEEEGGTSSRPTRHGDLLPSRDAWLDAAEKLAALDPPGDRSSLWRGDVCDLDGDEMDAYLEFFEQHILSDEKVPSRFTDVARFFPAPEVYDPPRPQYGAEAYLDKVDRILEPLYGPRAPPTPAPQRHDAPLPRPAARTHANGFEPLFPPSSTPAPPTSSPGANRRARAAGGRSSPPPPPPSPPASAAPSPAPRPAPTSPAPPPSHLPSILPSYSRTHTLALSLSPHAALPRPLHRLLALVAHHLTPAPLALHPALAGAAPTDAARGVASLVPFVEQVEWALERGLRGASAGAGASGPSEDEDEDEDERDGEDSGRKGPRQRTRAGAVVVDEREVGALERAGTLAAQAHAHAAGADPFMFEYADGQLGLGGAGYGESEDDEEEGTAAGSGSDAGLGEEEEDEEDDDDGSARSTGSGRSGTPSGLVNVRLIKTAEFITSSDDEEMDLDEA